MEISQWIEKNREQLIQDICTLVSVRSVSSHDSANSDSTSDAPFGDGCKNVLETALELAKNYGLKTENHEGRCASALLPGKTSRELGIFSHLDVVPEGNGWEVTSPYEPIIKDGWIYGRGSADNKGPAVSALYALRYLKENGITLNHTVRQFYGCDEENGMLDIEYYLSHHTAPDFSLVPDAAFPVCHGEKGRFTVTLEAPVSHNIEIFEGGEGKNSVPSGARLRLVGSPVTLTSQGAASHAASPEKGINAITLLARFSVDHGLVEGNDLRIFKFLSDALNDFYGSKLQIDCEDSYSGKLTVTATCLEYKEGTLTLTLDIRYPVTANPTKIETSLQTSALSYGWNTISIEHNPSFFLSPDSPIIRSLTNICQESYQRVFEPYCMSGGTYARKLPNAVGYGPGLSYQKKPCPEGHGRGHQPDECVCIDNLIHAVEIYIRALIMLDSTV